jgi:fatty acid desaturase
MMRAATTYYYSDDQRILRMLHLGGHERARVPYYRRHDALFAPLPFIWSWIEIALCVLLADVLHNAAAWAAAIVLVGGRFRALQEYGHNAVHFALCKSRKWQWLLSDFFYQFPSFKRDMHSREVTHTREHHQNPNHPSRDPNRARVTAGGMVAPMTYSGFLMALFYPLTPSGFRGNVVNICRHSMLNYDRVTMFVRLVSVTATTAMFFALAGWRGIVLGWIVPLLTTYPLFAWLALLTEHRWFVEGTRTSRLEVEYLMGRPTDYRGISGWMVRILVSPTSDAYHLAHSLYPGVRWNYLPAIDRALKVQDSRYTAHASEGFLISRHGFPSALSELYERLSRPPEMQRLQEDHGGALHD